MYSVTEKTMPVIAGVEITTDEEGRFNLNALHRASGAEKKNGPSYWMALDSTQALIAELEQTLGDTEISVSVIKTIKGGCAQGTFAHELLAVEYAGWISPAFRLKVNQTFIDYRSGKLRPSALPNAKELALMVIQAEEEKERLKSHVNLLENQVHEDAPKVEFHDKVAVAPGAMSVAQAAKILGTGRTRLFQFLRQIAWVTRYNEPYQGKIEAGYLDVKLGSWDHPDHGVQQSVTALITGKGLTKLQKLWAER
ncbi:phage antirepressor KilAC domain-containing protein [Serratia nevei]|nr:phage antirepressor KilAC domain-containing protein [Serratia nevei]